MTYRLKLLAIVTLAMACGPLAAQETVTIPVPALVQQGKSTEFKQTMNMNMDNSMMGQTTTTNMTMSMSTKQDYGKPGADGLIPVQTVVTITGSKVMAAGHDMPMPQIPPMKSTTYYDSAGKVKKATMDDAPKGEGVAVRIEDYTKMVTMFQPPSGPVTIGKPITVTAELPIAGATTTVTLTYTPKAVTEAQGERCLTVDLSGTTDIDLSKLEKGKDAPADMTGKGHITFSGTANVGLVTGEMINDSIKQISGISMDMQFGHMTVNGTSVIKGSRVQ